MKIKEKLLVTLAAGAIGLGASNAAMAHHSGWDRHQYGHQQHYKHHYKHHYQSRHHHWKHHHRGHAYVVRERVVVKRPVYVERYVQYAPPPRHPAVVLRVDFPSLAFGLH